MGRRRARPAPEDKSLEISQPRNHARTRTKTISRLDKPPTSDIYIYVDMGPFLYRGSFIRIPPRWWSSEGINSPAACLYLWSPQGPHLASLLRPLGVAPKSKHCVKTECAFPSKANILWTQNPWRVQGRPQASPGTVRAWARVTLVYKRLHTSLYPNIGVPLYVTTYIEVPL